MTDVVLRGRWEVEGTKGTISTNGVGAAYFHTADDCEFGDWHFQSVPSGFYLANATDCVVGNVTGDGFRGLQVATRTGTGGSALIFAGNNRCKAGITRATDVWKPAVYFSVATGLGDNIDCELGQVTAYCNADSIEAMAFTVRSGQVVKVAGVHGYRGIHAVSDRACEWRQGERFQHR